MAPHSRLRSALAAALGVAAFSLFAVQVDPGPLPVSPHRTVLSVRGELRAAIATLARLSATATRQGDAPLVSLLQPVCADLGAARGGTAPAAGFATARGSAAVPAAEARLATALARAGDPLVGALLLRAGDRRALPDARAVLMRVLALRWPARLAPVLASVLLTERSGPALFEAAVVAGRLAPDHPDSGLVPALRAAAARLSGWGRQYPIMALVLAGDRDAAALIRPALADREPAVRRHAALYLATTGDLQQLMPLSEVARRDADDTTRRVAQIALARMLNVTLAERSPSARDVERAGLTAPVPPAPERLAVRQLLYTGPQAALLAGRARSRLAAGTPLETLAGESQDRGPHTRQGRASPLLDATRFTPALRAALTRLTPGQISEPVASGAGVHLVQLMARAPGGRPGVAESRQKIEARLNEASRLAQLDEALLPRLAMHRPGVHE